MYSVLVYVLLSLCRDRVQFPYWSQEQKLPVESAHPAARFAQVLTGLKICSGFRAFWVGSGSSDPDVRIVCPDSLRDVIKPLSKKQCSTAKAVLLYPVNSVRFCWFSREQLTDIFPFLNTLLNFIIKKLIFLYSHMEPYPMINTYY